MKKITFIQTRNLFYTTLRQNVNKYFAEKNIKSTGDVRLFSKAIILFSLFVVSYVLMLVLEPGFFSILLSIFLGFIFAAIGFNIMHDGAHGSFSKKKWINEVCAYSLNLIGGSAFMWKIKHNVLHHSYANIEEVDDDIDIQPWMRVSKGQKRFWFHKFQHYYFILLYGVTYLLWVFYLDYQKYFSRKIASYKINSISVGEHFIFWGSKIIFLLIFALVPIYIVGFLNWMIGFLVLTFVTGFTISLVFQLAHVVEDAEFPLPNESNEIENNWALHQLATTADFSTKNKFMTWCLGGLNFQVVHHLFPKVSHIHYPDLQKIVRETCDAFQIKYIEYQTIWAAFGSHFRHLRMLGAK